MWTRLSQAESGVRTASLDSKPLGLWLLPPSRQPPCTLHFTAKRAQIDKKWHTICNQMLLICALQRRWTVLTCFDAGCFWTFLNAAHRSRQMSQWRTRSCARDHRHHGRSKPSAAHLWPPSKTWSLPSLNLPHQKIRNCFPLLHLSMSLPCLHHVIMWQLCGSFSESGVAWKSNCTKTSSRSNDLMIVRIRRTFPHNDIMWYNVT